MRDSLGFQHIRIGTSSFLLPQCGATSLGVGLFPNACHTSKYAGPVAERNRRLRIAQETYPLLWREWRSITMSGLGSLSLLPAVGAAPLTVPAILYIASI